MRAMHGTRGRPTAFLTTCLLLCALALPAAVAAHAQLESSSPEAGSTVETSPVVVSATFDDDLVADKSSIEVVAPDGRTVATGGVAADDPKTLTTDVSELAPGTYEVRWAAATEDGHLERGTYAFTVAAAASPEPTASPTEAAPAAPTAAMPSMSMAPSSPSASASSAAPSPAAASPAESPAPDGSGGGSESMGQILVIAVVGLALGLGLGWWRSRRAA
jgi:methionine-rich copper-binding protein CopC